MLRIALAVGLGVGGAILLGHRDSKQPGSTHKINGSSRRCDRPAPAVGVAAAAAPSTAVRRPRPTRRIAAKAPAILLILLALAAAAVLLFSAALVGRLEGVKPRWQPLLAGGTVAVAATALLLLLLHHQLTRPSCRALAAASGTHPRSRRRNAVAAAAAAALPPPTLPPQELLSGVWLKDREASDSMDAACQLMHMGGLLRTAIRLIKGLELHADPGPGPGPGPGGQQAGAAAAGGRPAGEAHQTGASSGTSSSSCAANAAASGGHFRMSVLSGLLWFKVTEQYPLDGAACRHRRRDLRRGENACEARRGRRGGGQVKLHCLERYDSRRLPPPPPPPPLQAGQHTGHVERGPAAEGSSATNGGGGGGGGLQLRVSWGEPRGGTCIDHFHLCPADHGECA